jgi:hypothetical protein
MNLTLNFQDWLFKHHIESDIDFNYEVLLKNVEDIGEVDKIMCLLAKYTKLKFELTDSSSHHEYLIVENYMQMNIQEKFICLIDNVLEIAIIKQTIRKYSGFTVPSILYKGKTLDLDCSLYSMRQDKCTWLMNFKGETLKINSYFNAFYYDGVVFRKSYLFVYSKFTKFERLSNHLNDDLMRLIISFCDRPVKL